VGKEHGRITRAISRIFDPVVEIPAALSLAVFWAIEWGFRWRFLLILLLIDAFLPFLFMVHLLRKGEISNWDIRDRRERIPLYLFTLIVHGIGVITAWVLGKEQLMLILLIFYLVAVVFMVTTIFWKISIHAGVNALVVTMINLISGWRYGSLYLLVLVVGWARVHDRHHTWAQVMMGAFVSSVMMIVGFELFIK